MFFTLSCSNVALCVKIHTFKSKRIYKHGLYPKYNNSRIYSSSSLYCMFEEKNASHGADKY